MNVQIFEIVIFLIFNFFRISLKFYFESKKVKGKYF